MACEIYMTNYLTICILRLLSKRGITDENYVIDNIIPEFRFRYHLRLQYNIVHRARLIYNYKNVSLQI